MGRVAESVAVTIQSPPSKGNKSKAMAVQIFFYCVDILQIQALVVQQNELQYGWI